MVQSEFKIPSLREIAAGAAVKEAKEELATDLAWLWEEYVLASPEDLSQDAKELAERLRIVFERHGLNI